MGRISRQNSTAPVGAQFWDMPSARLLQQLMTAPDGLTSDEAAQRLKAYGPNVLAHELHFSLLGDFVRFLLNPLVLILILASIISLIVGERVNAIIILIIVMLSVILNFFQEYQAQHAIETLRRKVASTAAVMRNKQVQERPVAELVPGDIVQLNAGDRVPADGRLLAVKDLFVREAVLTGESFPVEKDAGDLPAGAHALSEASNSVFLGTTVQSGIGTMVVVRTGRQTAFGAIAFRLLQHPPETEFDRGIQHFGLMITRLIILLVLLVFIINVLLKRPLFESFLFSVVLAVGLTPELLPMVISVTLAQGAKRMAGKKVVVKQLTSIENFGSIEILCSDKTGTLTEGDIVLDRHVTISGKDDEHVLLLAYLNSYFQAGIKSPLDDAILAHRRLSVADYHKIDEVPFDFSRKRLSVVIEQHGDYLLATKGAVDHIVNICTQVNVDGRSQPFTAEYQQLAERTFRELSDAGFRVLGIAWRSIPAAATYTRDDEHDMVLAGFAAFLDPPKKDVHDILQRLKRDGIQVIIMTGDNEFVTRKIADEVGLSVSRMITGNEVDQMEDSALAYAAEQAAIFARVSPEQKVRVILALKARGKVVGFLGDGINDAPSLHSADIGISVVNGVDVAKDAANIILMEKDLGVLHDGVLEGRRSFANIMKYITMSTSSNFGNMFSMAGASLLLPFLPMLPTQILLNNLLYDASQISIPTDNVDPELLQYPKRWHIDFIREFMLIIGPISSLYDFLTFGILIWIFHAQQSLFQTGWFVESLATQTLVVFVIRTGANPFRSKPSWPLIAAMLGMVTLGVVIPYLPFAHWLGFIPLPAGLLGIIALLTVTYLLLVQWVKSRFYRRHKLI